MNETLKNEMNKIERFYTPGYGEKQLQHFHYAQAVKIGDRVETSGNGGWNDAWEFPESLAEEIAQAFDNIGRTLDCAGATWTDVIAVNSYHLGFPEVVNQIMVEHFKLLMPNNPPLWTAVGVAALGDPKMRVEIRVTAILNQQP